MAQLLLLMLAARAWSAPGDEGWKAYLANDFAKAQAACQAAADSGDDSCQVLIGNLYLQGQGVPRDYKLAEKYFRLASDQGNAGGEQALAWCYQNGFGVAKDIKEAVRLFRKSAEKGDQWGENGLANLYFYGNGVKKDDAEAMKWFRRSAEQGNMYAQLSLGNHYYFGWGTKQDYAEAFKWWSKSAAQGEADAEQGLATLYLNGWGAGKDVPKAFEWYKKSSDQGNQWGQNGLGNMYFYGWGVKQDDQEAARLWSLSAEQGNVFAANGLGYCYKSGRGIAKDYAQALKWFRFGVEHGELSHNAANLASMYEEGDGVTQDYVEAYKWFLVGAAHDNPYARPGIERLKPLMTKEQIAEAQKLAAASEASSHDQPAAPAAPAAPAPAPAPAPSYSSAVDEPSFKSPERPDDLAVVVGVESYSLKDLPPASFAERDADAFAAHVRALGVPRRNLRVLKGSEATAGKLRGYLESWLPKNAKPGSRVYFYFSGHGAPNPQNGDAYLLPWDGDPALLKETAQPLKDVYSALGRLKAAQVVVALDACFSGAGGRSVISKGTRPLVSVREQKELPQGLTILTAASGDETTGTLDAEGHGLFTFYLLEGLDKGRKKSGDLCGYLKPKIADAAAHDNRTQTATCRGPDAAF